MAGNLGRYQQLTTLAKKVGGPDALLGLIFAGGIATGTAASLGAKKAMASYRKKFSQSHENKQGEFTLEDDVRLPNARSLSKGDTFSIIAQDGDSVFLQIDGRDDNPHVLSLKELSEVSDVPADFTL